MKPLGPPARRPCRYCQGADLTGLPARRERSRSGNEIAAVVCPNCGRENRRLARLRA